MTEAELLDEFILNNSGCIAERVTNLYKDLLHLNNTEEEIIAKLKGELEKVLEERINAFNSN